MTNISETSEEKYTTGKSVDTSPAAHNAFYIDPYMCNIDKNFECFFDK